MVHYLVSGHGRSGTSMMTRCLHLGGIPAYYDPEHKLPRHVNKYGAFEVPRSESTSAEAYATKWASMFEHPNMVVKVDITKIEFIPNDREFFVVFMLRNYRSILNSTRAILSPDQPDLIRLQDPNNYYKDVGRRLIKLTSMSNVTLQLAHYDEVIDHPLEAFSRLKNNGWPINIDRAVAGVEPAERKF